MKHGTLMSIAIVAVLLMGLSPVLEAQTVSNHNVYWIEGGVPGEKVDGGAAKVIREADGLSVVINTRHLVAGPVTVWLFFFACDPTVPGCNPTNGGPMFGTADVVHKNGKGTLAVGVPISSPFLTDPMLDEVHAVIADDKPTNVPMHERLRTPSGGTFSQVVIAIAP